jgi:hypothetical protein
MKGFRFIGLALLACVLGASLAASAQSWSNVTPAPNLIGPLLQLRDGNILAHSDQGGNANQWFILKPARNGKYETGQWFGPFSMQSGYAPFFFSSAVLTDGKTVVIEGGEYNNGQAVWTTLGSKGTYTPLQASPTISWAAATPPSGWSTLGDAQSVVLADGTYFQANCCTKQTAYRNPDGTWTAGPNVLAVRNDESGYSTLGDGSNRVMMVDVQTNSNCGGSTKSSEYYDFNGDKMWHCGPQLTQQLWQQSDQELGSGVVFYPSAHHSKGGMFQYGGNSTFTNILDANSFTWATGPTLGNFQQADGPGALEPNGLVLEQLSPGLFQAGCQFAEFDPEGNSGAGTLTNTVNNAFCPADSSFVGHLMIFPTGQIGSEDYDTVIYLYTPKSGVVSGVAPTIIPATNAYLGGSKNNVLYGIQLNGLSENNFYGDDYQAATNYPLIRFTDSSNNVYYGFTHDDSTHKMGAGLVSYTKFDIDPATPPGTYTMQAVTNGIPSNSVTVKIH